MIPFYFLLSILNWIVFSQYSDENISTDIWMNDEFTMAT